MAQCAGIKRTGGRCTVVVGAGQDYCYQHDPARADERRRNASRGGRSKGNGELPDLKRQLKGLAADVLKGDVETGRAAVANQLLNTVKRQSSRSASSASSRRWPRGWRHSRGS